ncbi:MAG: hypothetical protein JWO36_4286 [Myxococcales bacterium]|nr:hypothetical protein [Myxococcales bacterium]
MTPRNPPTRMTRVLLVLATMCGVARADHAAKSPEGPPPERTAYIAELIEAIRLSDPATLANTRKYIQIVERNKCQAPEMTLRVGCMLEAAAQNCKPLPAEARERCQRASDVIATNQLSERVFVPNDVRYQIMSKHSDARIAIARELHRRYAGLVAELAMSEQFPGPRADAKALAGGIDQFCTKVAGTRDLSWQYCVAAIVWFVAGDGAPEEAAR